MTKKTVSIDEFEKTLSEMLQGWNDDITEAIEEEVDTTAKKVLKEVKAASPRRIPEYYKGWKITKRDEYTRTKRIVWNKKHYNRVHLLEFGHAKADGGRVKEQPHVRPAYEKYGLALPDHIKRIIERGGRK